MVYEWRISGTALTLYLSDPVASAATVTVTYTLPTTGNITDLAGNALAAINAASVTNNSGFVPDAQAPTVPGSFAVTGVDIHQVSFSWIASTDNVGVTAYRLYQNSVFVVNIPFPAVAYTLTGVAPSVSKAYTLTAIDAALNESSASNTVNATALPDTPSTPGAPTAASPQQSVTLTWTAVARATGYQVFRSGALVATVATNTYTDVAPGGVYTYTVESLGNDGNSAQGPGGSGGSAGGGVIRPIVVGG